MLPTNESEFDTQVDQAKLNSRLRRPIAQMGWSDDDPAIQMPTLIALIDDDQMYREELARNLVDENFEVVEFGEGHSALDYFRMGRRCDVVLMDWKMPALSGAEMLDQFREMGLSVPIAILTAFCDERTEEDALDRGAIDVLHKSRSLLILAKRLRIIANGVRPLYSRDLSSGALSCGPLTVNVKMHRVSWKGERVPLTVTEFRIVNLLASRAGEDIAYREIYDVVHGKEFRAGDGTNGFHANVRSLIRHVRRKFRSLDADFSAIENYSGFGYRWRNGNIRREHPLPSDTIDSVKGQGDSVKGQGDSASPASPE